MSQLKRYNGTSWETVGGAIQKDTLPINAIVEYDGSTIPDGYELVEDYSTTERDTGKKWIDGSTIYEISGEKSITGRNTTVFTITNLKAVLYCQGYLKRTGSYHNIINFGKDSSDYGLMYVNNNNIIFDSSYTGTLYATIRYIKTS